MQERFSKREYRPSHSLAEARDVQWDYKNLVRRKGRLERLK